MCGYKQNRGTQGPCEPPTLLVFQDDVQCVYNAGTAEDRLKHVEVGND